MERPGTRVYEHLLAVHGNTPFAFRNLYELWLPDRGHQPLARVLEYFRRAGGFRDPATEMVHGLPRPADDKYADRLALPDPVLAVWAQSDVGQEPS